MVRFSGGLHLVSGQIVIEAELDTGAAARRLRKAITDLYGFESELMVISASGIRRGNRYVLRLVRDGEAFARQTGLLDSHGRPVRGLPPQVVGAGMNEQVAVWRGAFLARGSLTEPGRSMSLEVTCPSSEAALALVGAARRLDIGSKAREVRQRARRRRRPQPHLGARLRRGHDRRAGAAGPFAPALFGRVLTRRQPLAAARPTGVTRPGVRTASRRCRRTSLRAPRRSG